MQSKNMFLKQRLVVIPLILTIMIIAFFILQSMFMKYNKKISFYLESSTAFCRIPGIDDGFIPQGIAYDSGSKLLLLTGYYGAGKSSPIYLVDQQTCATREVFLKTESGKRFTGHAGGISLYKGMAYIAGSTENCMYSVSLGKLFEAENGTTLSIEQVINLKNRDDSIRVSFTAIDDGVIFAGEYHNTPFFCTQASHLVDTPYGRQKAFLVGFSLDEGNNPIPHIVFSIPDKIQGACFYGNNIFLSQNDNLFSSKVLTFSLDKLQASGTKKVLGAEVPIYILTEKTARKITYIPPMSEELLVIDGQMLILYESAANLYSVGKKYGLDYVLATPLSFFTD